MTQSGAQTLKPNYSTLNVLKKEIQFLPPLPRDGGATPAAAELIEYHHPLLSRNGKMS